MFLSQFLGLSLAYFCDAIKLFNVKFLMRRSIKRLSSRTKKQQQNGFDCPVYCWKNNKFLDKIFTRFVARQFRF